MDQSEKKTVSIELAPRPRSSADWLFPLRKASRRDGRLKFVAWERSGANGTNGATNSSSNGKHP